MKALYYFANFVILFVIGIVLAGALFYHSIFCLIMALWLSTVFIKSPLPANYSSYTEWFCAFKTWWYPKSPG